MPLTDPMRINAARDRPRIVALWQALTALKSVVSFMNTGAHPDDEISDMLAAMRFRDGIDTSYACSTRGEGGQNDIGTETAAALGTLRTAEMEAACDRIDLRMYWLSLSPEDPITDFGFSKSGVETLAKWGRERTLARFVDILRTERPDIICPTFLDVPGQHGHHRAMTQAAHLVMDLAADPDFTGSTLPIWQVRKMYLPAWSGAGQAYDDDLPPPPETIKFVASDKDPVTGWSFARIGQQSRVMHATQAMGRWIPAGRETDRPLHLAHSTVDGPDLDLTSGLPKTLRDLPLEGLDRVQDACDAAIAAFPDPDKVLAEACAALDALQKIQGSSAPEDLSQIAHKLARKNEQLARVIHLAAGAEATASLDVEILHPGDRATLTAETSSDVGDVTATLRLPQGWTAKGADVSVGKDASMSDPYPAVYLPGQPNAPCLDVTLKIGETATCVGVPFDVPPVVIPKHSATLSSTADMINLAHHRRAVSLAVNDISPASAQMDLDVPDGWSVAKTNGCWTVTAPEDVRPGLYDVALTLDGQKAQSLRHIRRNHITPRVLSSPAITRIRVIEAKLPDVKVGYIGGGNDRVGLWLERMGVCVQDLSNTDLSDAGLDACDTIVIGIFAMKFRAGLAEAMPRIHKWIAAGGTLVTLYHRPWDNWDANQTAPHRLEIGQPSLRWRVTDEGATVTTLVPDHPVLNEPNKIGEADWAGWHKERGLYFAKDWAAAYTPLLAMKDDGEAPLKGALLVADVGLGRHIHTSLILHHQMEKLTPGAFRLMANLLAKRD